MFRLHEVEAKYYADGEDAYMMKKVLQPPESSSSEASPKKA